ncbi:MAG: hypothetical protein LW626_08670, partial [Verrucomicrobium sp.]|nr:hypothetical protein [Verrucomicrobium sp.]
MLASLLESWGGLTTAAQVYFSIGLLAGAVSLILGVMSAVGLEHHDVVDLPDTLGWDAGGGGIFSVKPLTG